MPETLCKHCDHFVTENWFPEEDILSKTETTIVVRGYDVPLARFVHCEDGEQEFDHNAEPGETRDDWKTYRPDLFIQHPDGAIGPNSSYHKSKGGQCSD